MADGASLKGGYFPITAIIAAISASACIASQALRAAHEQYIHHGFIGFAICRLADRKMEGERSSESISQAVKLLVNPSRERSRTR
ncbi:hypothetical protein D6851_02185 [Altericroceibacterium spongiae]|uniref:Uncharacterized protein n=1 Tax=Altericroceibacterium spongiae TaxID=2320269 RepID=A0A420ERJ8_9SPHN|nr:hypothetical protein D6851_02185 [Altericroceibacterium spongiae]